MYFRSGKRKGKSAFKAISMSPIRETHTLLTPTSSSDGEEEEVSYSKLMKDDSAACVSWAETKNLMVKLCQRHTKHAKNSCAETTGNPYKRCKCVCTRVCARLCVCVCAFLSYVRNIKICYEDMTDHDRSYAQNLSSCAIKA